MRVRRRVVRGSGRRGGSATRAGGSATGGDGTGTTTTEPNAPPDGGCRVPGAPFSTSPAPVSGVLTTSNVAYGTQPGEVLDVARPSTGSGRPAVLLVHGGGWMSGDKSELTGVGFELAQAGYVTFNADYTLADAHLAGYPMQLQELEAAVGWIRANADRYGVDPTRIAALGSSAGGNLVGLLAAVPTGACTSGDRVAAVVSWSGPMDLTALDEGVLSCPERNCAINYTGIGDFAGCPTAGQCPSSYIAASPDSHVSGDTCPVALFNGSTEVIPASQAEIMSTALTRAGVPNEVEIMVGSQHASAYADRAMPATEAWLREWIG